MSDCRRVRHRHAGEAAVYKRRSVRLPAIAATDYWARLLCGPIAPEPSTCRARGRQRSWATSAEGRHPAGDRGRPARLATMSQTYSDVDSSSDPSGAVAWQESMATWPSVARYKQQTYHLLTEARVELDIGCGPGVDLVGLGSGRSVGVDRSARMCSAAARHGSWCHSWPQRRYACVPQRRGRARRPG